ncbi:putative P-loop hydrolase, UPF0079-family [Corynebacterium kutscheri]|uniref:tRNA threonylcarbamoyladenosine biosynthesis protein TsaE n=1 Tax=Corynebacterium kutscheri TaxID=35755 RepID=A0A0F6QYK0_9CORY|nr:tRNA (adenosine(37)-N6)-threonylcarbamoyltransferase complex ATPase subunit type 1 TsaE [Corynebacterium kutscheri]AKE40622.1 tRNA threonylcarbamoyl adenosine modification protein YjeE [Corynebacterium kutscheri]VEH04833.1 putative P-loop hydrolase, UPF0079-family [Corynebacterium kutscheri]VEH11019.1 putative P-loop hydrolase, UPF0079-family [Corynebacterium kutscheri]VEH80502.1 putative P-loop hydrolase, UPF0079-family [Corynebacterium kutscheri]
MDKFLESGSARLEHAVDTQALGEQFGRVLRAGDVVILDGPLGAGKTTFTQGIARGMQVKGRVTSPTFTIARVHRSLVDGPSLIHVDAYRLLGEDDHVQSGADALAALDSLDLDTELDQAVVVAEWGGGLVENIAEQYIVVSFDRTTAVLADPDSEARFISWQLVEQK